MKGVTLRTYRDFISRSGRPIPSGRKTPTKDDLRAIPGYHLQTIYREGYWDVIQADKLTPGVDLVMFDFAVNAGPARAVIELQRHLQSVRGGDLADDGIMGPITLGFVAAWDNPGELIRLICARRMRFKKNLKNWPHHGKGWTNRVNDIRDTALRMVEEAGE